MAETLEKRITLNNFFEQVVEVDKVANKALKQSNESVSISEKNKLDLEKLIQTLKVTFDRDQESTKSEVSQQISNVNNIISQKNEQIINIIRENKEIGGKVSSIIREDEVEDRELKDSFSQLQSSFNNLSSAIVIIRSDLDSLSNAFLQMQRDRKRMLGEQSRVISEQEDTLQKSQILGKGRGQQTQQTQNLQNQQQTENKTLSTLKQFLGSGLLAGLGLGLGNLGGDPGDAPVSGDLREIISGGEGGLNSVNRGNANDTPGGAISVLGRNLTDMTVDEVYAAQKSKKISAAGKNQITPVTMPGFRDYLKRQGVDTSKTKYDEKTQNMFFDYAITEKRPEVGQYLKGGNVSLDAATLALAAEYASVGVPYDMKKGSYNGKLPVRDIKKGETLYAGGPGNNQASISPETIKESLRKQREKNINPAQSQSNTGGQLQPASGDKGSGKSPESGQKPLNLEPQSSLPSSTKLQSPTVALEPGSSRPLMDLKPNLPETASITLPTIDAGTQQVGGGQGRGQPRTNSYSVASAKNSMLFAQVLTSSFSDKMNIVVG